MASCIKLRSNLAANLLGLLNSWLSALAGFTSDRKISPMRADQTLVDSPLVLSPQLSAKDEGPMTNDQ